MKTCIKCGVTKELQDFQKCARNKDGHTSWCKVCKRQYDRQYHGSHPDRNTYLREKDRERVAVVNQYIYEYLQTHPCVDCGETDPVVLEFDHLQGKSGDIGTLRKKASLETVQREVLKCVVRCANCHRRKTAKDFNHWKVGYAELVQW